SPQFDEWAFFRREALRGRAIQALERVVQDRNAAGDYAAAAAHAGRLVALDPLSEVYARHLIRNLLLGGDRAAAERHLEALTQRLRDELDVVPEAETRALLSAGASSPVADLPPTRYVSGGGVHLAFQTYGAGRFDVLVLGGFVSHVERVWEEPRCRRSYPHSHGWAASSCSIGAASGFLTGSGSTPASTRPRGISALCLAPPAAAGRCCSVRPRPDRHASNLPQIIPIASQGLVSSLSCHGYA